MKDGFIEVPRKRRQWRLVHDGRCVLSSLDFCRNCGTRTGNRSGCHTSEAVITLNIDCHKTSAICFGLLPFKKFVGTRPLLPSFFFTLVQPPSSASTSFTTSSLARSTNLSSFAWKACRAMKRFRCGFLSMVLAGCHKLYRPFGRFKSQHTRLTECLVNL